MHEYTVIGRCCHDLKPGANVMITTYDDFHQVSVKKLAVVLKPDVMIIFFCIKRFNFCEISIFLAKILLKILTLTPRTFVNFFGG
jgi:hypothetical protein